MERLRWSDGFTRGLLLASSLVLASAGARAQFGEVGGGGIGSGWSVAVDPPAAPLTVAGKELAIPIPQGFGHGAQAVFPSTVSPFVAVGKNEFDQDLREVWDLRTKTKVGLLRGKLDWKGLALSPDGALIVGIPTFRKMIEVRSAKNGRVVASLEPIGTFDDYADFGPPGTVVGGRLLDKSVKVWNLKSGDPAFEIHFADSVEKKALGYSPGRRYLAAYTQRDATLRVYDLADGGKSVGEQVVLKGDGEAFNPKCVGVAFSDDGADLAAVFESFGKVRIVAWSVKDGKATADHTIDPKAKDKVVAPPFYEDLGIQWLPDKSGWLAFGSSIVDRESGQKVWSLPFDNQNFTVSPRRLVDNGRALIVFGGGKILRTAPIPADKVQAAMKLVRSGGNAADAALPTLKAPDLASAKSVAYSGSTPWSARPDPRPTGPRPANRPIPLKAKLSEILAILASGPEAAQVLVAGAPSAFGRPDTNDGVSRWVDRYDLTSGKPLGRQEIPSVSELVAFSPDATRYLVRERKTRDRLDAFGVEGKPVVGWRPYEGESGEGRAVAFAAFLDAHRVVTVSGAGRLVLWSLPDAQALYAVDGAFDAAPALSPGRSTLAGPSGEAIRFVDTATGALKGEVPAGVGPRDELKAAAFRGDGTEWAGLFGNGRLVRVDVAAGRLAGAMTAPVQATALEYCGPGHLLADGKTLIDLANRRALWSLQSGPSIDASPDGRHWFACARTPDAPATLAAVLLPEPGMGRMAAQLADPASPAVVRPGSTVSVQLEFPGGPRKAEEFRKSVFDLVTKKLQAAGLKVANGQPVTFVVRVTERPTGENLELRKIGPGAAPGGPFNRSNLLSIPVVDLDAALDVRDASGSPVNCGTTKLGMRSFFHILRLPRGETDVAAYLKDAQWEGLKRWLETTSLPYFVARNDGEVARLPGVTDLNALYGKLQ